MERHIQEQRGGHSSHNLAKRVFEFSVEIPRHHLRPCYGEGFHGAPVDHERVKASAARREDGGDHDPADAEGSECAGGTGEV